MTSRLLSGAALAALLLTPAHAQPPARDVTSPLAAALTERFQGERVFTVLDPYEPAAGKTVRAPSDDKLLHRLQTLCEAFSTYDRTLAPFAVRGTWVVAPLSRDEVVADFNGLTPLDVMGRSKLIQRAVAKTPPDKVAALGSEQGVAATDLPPDARDALLRALRSPLRVYSVKGASLLRLPTGELAAPRETSVKDPRGVRLRAQLYSSGVTVPGVRGTASPYGPGPDDRLIFGPHSTAWSLPTRFPAIRRVPNSFKPSDLDGNAYMKRLGFHGGFPLPDFLARLSEATGLNLKASDQYHNLYVLVESDDVTQGEALDGLRLALTAAWRKVGDVYLLTWDRRGLGALDTLLSREASGLELATYNETRAAENGPLMDLALTLPFASDDPAPWTDAQRDKLFGTVQYKVYPGGMTGPPVPVAVSFDEMTPSQQQAAREQVEQAVTERSRRPAPPDGRPMPPLDTASATLNPGLYVRISVQVPGVGWVDAPQPPALWADTARTNKWMRKAAEDVERQRRQMAEQQRVDGVPPHAPPRPTAANRALMVPALDTAALGRILPLMKARGFSALFYPAFTDGYATFPTTAFPQRPASDGRGGLADAVRLAHDNGVAVAATVEVMAWRRPGERNHWTNAEPGWLGRDILGRTLTEAVAASPARNGGNVTARGDVARLAPETTRRLEHLLADLARVPGVQGVLFDAWSPETILSAPIGLTRGGFAFALPDRLAVIASDSVDPVDVQPLAFLEPEDAWAICHAPPEDLSLAPRKAPSMAPSDPYAELLGGLLAGARTARPEWKEYVTTHEVSSRRPAFAGAATVRLGGVNGFARPEDTVLVPAVPGGSLAEAEARSGWTTSASGAHLILYDFRDAPAALLPAMESADQAADRS